MVWKSFYASLVLQEFLTDMGTAYLIKENGTEKLPIELKSDYCVTFEGIYYCDDPQDFEERVRSDTNSLTRPRPLKEKMVELVLDFYSKLDSGDFIAIAKFGEDYFVNFFVFTGNITSLSPLRSWGLHSTVRGVLKDWDSYAWKHAVENSIGHYVSNGSAIAGSLIKGLRVYRISPPNAYIRIKTLRGIVNAVYEIAKFRRKSRAKVVVWDHGDIYGTDRADVENIVKLISLKH